MQCRCLDEWIETFIGASSLTRKVAQKGTSTRETEPMTIGLKAYISNPKNLTVISVLVLIIILAAEVGIITLVGTRLPARIATNLSIPMVQSLIAFDGVLLGFAAVVFNSLMNRESTFERISYLFTSMFVTVILFLLSVTSAFFALAAITTSGLEAGAFVLPLGFMVYGTSVLFFTIYIHVARSRQAFK
jgi:hypothetical protein